LPRALATVRERLGVEPVAVTVPLGDDEGAVAHLLDKTRLHFAGERGEQVTVSPWDEVTWRQMRPLARKRIAGSGGDGRCPGRTGAG
jgi:elongation factor G